jgi:hypothetical protein
MDTKVKEKDLWNDLKETSKGFVNMSPICCSVFICLHTIW